jgi:hypothetical protein
VNNSTSNFATTLNQATTGSSRPTSVAVFQALQQAEITTRQDKLAIPFDDLLGEWQLCFATGAKKSKQRRGIVLGKGYYFPKFIPASIAFTRDSPMATTGTATNQVQVGGLRLKFNGPCRYPDKKNLLIFDFTDIQISLFDRQIYQGKIRSGKTTAPDLLELPISKSPFFAFFWATNDGIAARGRGGGLALWVRQK